MISTQRAETGLGSLYHWHTVLIVDDEPPVLAALRRVLDREPYDIVTTDRPNLALEWMGRKSVSLAISDQLMPEMNGGDFLEEVSRQSPLTARLLLTAYPERVRRIPMVQQGLLQVMTKPWDDFELKRTIRSLLREREGSTE
jgi:response regulator RpfG family c-di-GMP phosphodiesterase